VIQIFVLLYAQASAETAVEASEPLPIQWDLTLGTTGRWVFDDGNVTGPEDRNWDPVGEDFRDVVTKVGGSIRWREFQLSLRLDSAIYGNESIAAENASQLIKASAADRYEDTIRLEYVSGLYSSGKDSVTLGDFYVTLGRGLILAVRKVDDVGIDNKLRGASFEMNPVGDLVLHAFGGLLDIANFEQGTGYAYDEPKDLIGGARVEYGFGKVLKLGVHGMRYATFGLPRGDENETFGWGGTIALPRPVPWASLYLEGGHLLRKSIEAGLPSDLEGYGFYASSDLSFGALTILVEGKFYRDLFQLLPGGRLTSDDGRQLLNRLQEPPTAERTGAIILTNRSVGGGRVRFDYRVSELLTPFVSVGQYRDFENEITPSNITGVSAGSRFVWSGGHALVDLAFRGDFSDQRSLPVAAQFGNPLLTQDWQWVADIAQEIVAGYSLELASNGRYALEQGGSTACAEDDVLEDGRTCDGGLVRDAGGRQVRRLTSWVEGRVALSFSSSDKWSVTAAWELYTKSPDTFRPHYFSIGGQWEFWQGWTARALIGQERAGLKCSGGACRFFPGFEGGRLELSVRI
jgi:hypothetical protein